VERWYASGEPRHWREIKLSLPWYYQEVVAPDGRPYRGVAWYRVVVDLPTLPPTVRLYFPDVRGSAVWVWCHGQFAGYLAKGDQADLSLDLSAKLRPGRETFALRVEGQGGLALPPFLCAPVGEPRK
jgi:hypothetical protein